MNKLFLLIVLPILSLCKAQNNTSKMESILSPYSFTTHYSSLKEGQIAYTKEGTGKPVLLFIHGLSSNADAWSRNIEELKKYFTCIAIDLPGHGKSYKKAEEFTPTYFAKTIKEFADQQKIKQFVLIGHSMGGQASIKFAQLYPKYVEKLILIAPAGIEEFSEAESSTLKTFTTRDFVIKTSDEQIDKNYSLNFYKMPNEAKKMVDERKKIKTAHDFNDHALAIEKSVSGMLDDKVIGDIQNLKLPVLFLFAQNDMLIPNKFLHPLMTINDVAGKAQELMPKAKIIIIPESGHFLQFEKPEMVNKEIRTFISSYQ